MYCKSVFFSITCVYDISFAAGMDLSFDKIDRKWF